MEKSERNLTDYDQNEPVKVKPITEFQVDQTSNPSLSLSGVSVMDQSNDKRDVNQSLGGLTPNFNKFS